MQRQFDAANRLTTEIYADETLSYQYDTAGQLTQVTDGAGSTRYAYDPHGRITGKTQTVGGQTLTLGYGYQGGQLRELGLSFRRTHHLPHQSGPHREPEPERPAAAGWRAVSALWERAGLAGLPTQF